MSAAAASLPSGRSGSSVHGGQARSSSNIPGSSGPLRGEQQGDGQAVDAGREVGEPSQRWRVRPVRVVHGDHQRPAGREVRGQPVEAVRGRVRDVVLDRSGAGPVEHPRGEPGGAVEQLVPLAGTGRHADRIDELAGDAVGEAALQGEPAGGEDPRAGHLWAGAGHPEQRGLADAGRPLHQDERAVPRLGGLGRRRQHRQLRVAPENHRVTVEHGTRPRTGAGYRLGRVWCGSNVRPG
jgi:hypothetical protein